MLATQIEVRTNRPVHEFLYVVRSPMRLKNEIGFCAIVATMLCGQFAYGQNKEKPAEVTKPVSAGAERPKTRGPVPLPVAGFELPNPESQDEKAIRSSAESFVKLYNEHDSKGLSELFALKAEIIDENEEVVKGREAIEQAFADVFKARPECSIQLTIESLRVLTPNLAIEEGVNLSKNSTDDDESESSYVAIHVKVDGKWLLACVRDWAALPAELTPHDHLQELGWIVGEWIQETPDSVIHSVCHWHDNNNFLMQEFRVQIGGDVAMSGTMRIGWDAVSKQFKSWIFDSHGGHAEGMWHRDGDSWIVKLRGSTARGETASATSVYRQIDEETMSWRSTDRIVDGERQSDIDEIVVKRRPPTPTE
jgi:uncharacterized protein (TIGR02246 family)